MLDIVDLIAVGTAWQATVCLYSHQTADANDAWLVRRRWTRTRILAWHEVDRTESH